MLCSACRQSQCKMLTEQNWIQSYRSTCNRVSGVQGVLLKKVISPQQSDEHVDGVFSFMCWCMHFESVVQSADMTQEASITPLSAGSSLSPASGADCSGKDCVSPRCSCSVELHACACFVCLHHQCLIICAFILEQNKVNLKL